MVRKNLILSVICEEHWEEMVRCQRWELETEHIQDLLCRIEQFRQNCRLAQLLRDVASAAAVALL